MRLSFPDASPRIISGILNSGGGAHKTLELFVESPVALDEERESSGTSRQQAWLLERGLLLQHGFENVAFLRFEVVAILTEKKRGGNPCSGRALGTLGLWDVVR